MTGKAMPPLDLARYTLVQRIRAAKAEVEQYFRDVDHWNRQHPEETPIDGDPDGRLGRIHDAYAKCLANEERLSREGKS